MATPRKGAPELVVGQGSKEDTSNEADRFVEQGADYYIVIDKDLTAPPGSPSDGDCYIVGDSATGDWSGHDAEVAFRMSTAWAFITPDIGTMAYAQDEDEEYRYAGGSPGVWGLVASDAAPYDIPLSYAAGPPTADEVMGGVMVVRAVDFAANFAGSDGHIGTNPTGSFVISVKDDGSEIGTITISTGGGFTFATTGGTAKTVGAGSRLEFVAPNTPDGTAAYILATLAGTS